MRRLVAALLVVCCAATLAVLGTGAGEDGGSYKVRALFRNAFSLVPGEDVKIAGVRVGSIAELDVTPEQQAAVVLEITEPGFADFRADAECSIRPQSLIGEKFVECVPTQPRPAGTEPPPPLQVIPEGEEGEGQHLLPVENTSRPVDIDLVSNVMRLPYRQRLGIVVREFGTALAGRGEDLRSVIRNADPALKATDDVLRLLASQERTLNALAEESRASLVPLARERDDVQAFVEEAAALATATAEKEGPLGEQFERLPVFLRELRPTMRRLGSFADQATPVLGNLRAVAPDVSRLVAAMGPFAESTTASLVSLGEATVPGRRALVAAESIVEDLRRFGRSARPLSRGLARLTTSFKKTGGIERALDYLFYQVAAINGYDAFGHYLRASLLVNLCTTYATSATKDIACTANFQKPFGRAAGRSLTAEEALHTPGVSLLNRRTAAVLRGMSPEEAIRLTAGESDPVPEGGEPAPVASGVPVDALEAQGSPPAQPEQRLLDYLLGGDA